MIRRRRALAALVAAAALLAACSGDTSLPRQVDVTTAPTTTAAAADAITCPAAEQGEDPTRSYPPLKALPSPDALPANSTMADIKARGRLVVGVSADTLKFGSRNPITGVIEGFDDDMLADVAKAIFGTDNPGNIEYRIITYAQRIPSLQQSVNDGGVDIVAHTMTINCVRWQQIAFSSEYYHAGQKVLVKKSAKIDSIEALVKTKATVCAPNGSTNLDEMKKPEYAGLTVISEDDITDCLVDMQEGKADAATGDDTVLAGFVAQDPTTEVVGRASDGAAFTSEPYGLGIPKQHVDFVQFVNAVLEQVRTDGRWAGSYTKWLLAALSPDGTVPAAPAALYGRPVPTG
jgi:polar amino acid transport system substrate-binding protein